MEENIEIKTDQKELIIREGKAPEVIALKALNLSGIINAPLEFLKVRKGVFDNLRANIQVDREGLKIILSYNEDTELESNVTGSLQLTDEFKSFAINSGKGWIPRDLAEHIKMNRVCFASKDVANKLASILMDVKIRIDKVVENNSGQRANLRQLKEQTLKECNIPEDLTLEMPIFKGSKRVSFKCEIWISPEDLSVKLISPDAADIIRTVRDEEIDTVIDAVRGICPELAIIEI
jgi:hypothetical protein